MKWLVGLIDYNSLDDTEKCLQSIKTAARFSTDEVSVVVVCNGDGPIPNCGSADEDEVVRVRWIDSSRNIGFAGGANVLLDMLSREDWDVLWLLNNDCKIRADSFSAFHDAVESSRFDVYTSMISHEGGQECWYGGGKIDVRSLAHSHENYGKRVDSLDEDFSVNRTGWASGANLVIPSRSIANAKLMRNDFFLYLEELEWQLTNSFRVGLLNAWLVDHSAGSTTSRTGTRLELFYSSRNFIKIALSCPSVGKLRALITWLQVYPFRAARSSGIGGMVWPFLGALACPVSGRHALAINQRLGASSAAAFSRFHRSTRTPDSI